MNISILIICNIFQIARCEGKTCYKFFSVDEKNSVNFKSGVRVDKKELRSPSLYIIGAPPLQDGYRNKQAVRMRQLIYPLNDQQIRKGINNNEKLHDRVRSI